MVHYLEIKRFSADGRCARLAGAAHGRTAGVSIVIPRALHEESSSLRVDELDVDAQPIAGDL